MSSIRFTGQTATVEWGGIRVRGTVKSFNLGLVKRTGVVNGDRSVDFHEEHGMGSIEIEGSVVADVELATMATFVGEPMLVTCGGQKVSFPAMTWTEGGEVSGEGSTSIKASGPAGTMS